MELVEQYKHYYQAHEIFKKFNQEKYSVMLDSSKKDEEGRYTIIGKKPSTVIVSKKGICYINEKPTEGELESILEEYLKRNKDKFPKRTSLPFENGAIGFLSYDHGMNYENVSSRHEKDMDIPDGIFCFYHHYIIEDAMEKKLYLSASNPKELFLLKKDIQEWEDEVMEQNVGNQESDTSALEEKTLDQEGDLWKEREIKKDSHKYGEICKITGNSHTKCDKIKYTNRSEADFTKEEYQNTIQDVIDYIVNGDIYVMNMTRQFREINSKDPFAVYMDLRELNPAPFGGYHNYGDFQIISSSLERFFQVKEGKIMTCPIKGTRKRGDDKIGDEEMKDELFYSEKDRSELLMIVDLERNDLNRICDPGSVQVEELFKVKTYPAVHHLVAKVSGKLSENIGFSKIIKSMFPGGSITGAPKIRAMEIIDELEQSPRGIYTGTIGYIGFNGDMDFNIVIRTAIHKNGTYYIGAGGGITYESDCVFEYEETGQKAQAMLNAIRT